MKATSGWLVLALALGSSFACQTTSTDADVDSPDAAGGTAAAGTGGQSTGGVASGGASGGTSVLLGERGSSCDASSDCQEELSCIVTAGCPVGVACANKTCQPSNFEIMGTGKQCHVVQCQEREDCCGDMPLLAPEKCDVRNVTCNQPTLAGCTAISCTSDDQCGAGTCAGLCNYDTTVQCLTTADCEENVCDFGSGTGGGGSGGSGGSDGSGGSGGGSGYVAGTCSVTNTICYDDTDCVVNSCSSPYCRCENPEYDPADPICEDEDCEGICGWTCDAELCVADTSCKIDADCVNTAPFCDDGSCVECVEDEDCEEEDCISGRCGPECEVDTECGLFEVCQEDACVYVGCQTDRECVLSPQGQSSDQDPRLSVCLIEDGIGTCVFPCDIDAQCGTTEICVDSVCEYIGCETDTECKTIAGLHNRPPPTEDQPWMTSAECRAEASESE